jgi:hypothetical protein
MYSIGGVPLPKHRVGGEQLHPEVREIQGLNQEGTPPFLNGQKHEIVYSLRSKQIKPASFA